jgi:creatinine amidohydrolase
MLTESTGVGNPYRATREKGETFLKDVTGKIGNFLVDLAGTRISEMYK